jgi:hypothetical protein
MCLPVFQDLTTWQGLSASGCMKVGQKGIFYHFACAAMDYYIRQTTFHSQFRTIGKNYNQVTKAIKSTFTEKKGASQIVALLDKFPRCLKGLSEM